MQKGGVLGGNNDLRFKLPSQLLKVLRVRRTAGASNLLTLTPTAPNGTTVGTAVTRTVQVTPAAKVKAKRRK